MTVREWLGQHRPAPGRASNRRLRERIDLARLAVVKAGRHAGQSARNVAAQGLERARLTGAKLARHVVAVQKAAGLSPHLMRESARSVMNRPMTRDGDRAWQAAYVAQAARLGVPGMAQPVREPAAAPPAAPPERPSWPHITPSGPDREAAG
jgi:hypothetical protein